jgi:hypothetical protein
MRHNLPPGMISDYPRPVARNINVLKPGPKTPQGKAIASQNSLRHGLTARTVVLTEESQEEFDSLLAGITTDRKPVGELEIQLTGEIAACLWRLARARQHESLLLETTTNVHRQEPERLALIMRYSASIERQLNRAMVRLEYLQNQRRNNARSESVSQIAEKTLTTDNNQPATPDSPPPTTHNAPLVMVAGSSRPHFVSQTEQTEPTAGRKAVAASS